MKLYAPLVMVSSYVGPAKDILPTRQFINMDRLIPIPVSIHLCFLSKVPLNQPLDENKYQPEAQSLVPDWVEIDDSYRPARLHRLAGRTLCLSRLYPPSQGIRIWILNQITNTWWNNQTVDFKDHIATCLICSQQSRPSLYVTASNKISPIF